MTSVKEDDLSFVLLETIEEKVKLLIEKIKQAPAASSTTGALSATASITGTASAINSTSTTGTSATEADKGETKSQPTSKKQVITISMTN